MNKQKSAQQRTNWKTITLKAVIVIVSIVCIIFCIICFSFWKWSSEKNHAINKGSKIANTTQGQIEYKLVGETGPVVLVIHGVMGGYDFGLGIAQMLELEEAGYRVLSVSRPGYLNTPLNDNNLTPSDQASLYVSLLDELDIQSVALIAVSGGGPSTLEFANQYPDRVWGIIMAVTITHQWEFNEASRKGTDFLKLPPLVIDLAMWYTTEIHFGLDAKGLVHQTILDNTTMELSRIDEITEQAFRDTEKLNNLMISLHSSVPLSRRWEGTENDLFQQQNLDLKPNFNKIIAPVLAFYGESDPLVPITHGQYLDENLKHLELYFEPEGGHAPFLQKHWSFIKERSVSFLNENSLNITN